MKPSDAYLLNAAWLDDSLSFLAVGLVEDDGTATIEALRPFSLGSWLACDLMGLEILNPDSALDMGEEIRQVACFRWLHSADLGSVKRLISNGGYRVAFWGDEEPVVTDVMLAAFRVWRDAWCATVAAAAVSVLPKKARGLDGVPAAVVGPSLHTWRVEFLAGKTGLAREFIRWELPSVQALQMLHHHLWYDGSWTARAGSQVALPAKEFEGLGLFAFDAPADEVGEPQNPIE
jgi:hypothetical protein